VIPLQRKGQTVVTERERPALDSREDAVDVGDVTRVTNLLQSLSKLIQGKKIYARNNPTLMKFAEEFHAGLRKYFKDHEDLVLGVEQQVLRWRGEIVYDADSRDENIAFLLYKDGIGEVSIDVDAPAEEVDLFIDIVKDELHRPDEDADDVVTQLWKADFNHISYRVLDEYLVGEYGEGRSGEAGATAGWLEKEDHTDTPGVEDKGRVIVDTDRYDGSIEGYLNELVDRSYPNCPAAERDLALQELVESMFNVNPHELQRCQEEFEVERKRDVLVDFLDAILPFVLKDNPKMFRDVCNVLDSVTSYILSESRLTALANTLLSLRAFAGSAESNPAAIAYLLALEERFTETEFLLSLKDKAATEPQAVFSYYRQVGKRSVPAVCTLLQELDHPAAHQQACDVLVDVAAEDVPGIIDTFDLDEPRLAHDALYLLRRLGTGGVPSLVGELMFYPDARVRDETIQYLCEVGNDDAAVLLVRLLEHDDKQTRLKALGAMENVSSPIILNRIMLLAFDKELGGRSPDEREHVFRTLGKCVGTRALPDIKRMLSKKTPFGFGKGQKQQAKVLAIRALEHMPGDEALVMLGEMAADTNGFVKSRAQRALKSRQSREDS
jgi:HEAT repeat protein